MDHWTLCLQIIQIHEKIFRQAFNRGADTEVTKGMNRWPSSNNEQPFNEGTASIASTWYHVYENEIRPQELGFPCCNVDLSSKFFNCPLTEQIAELEEAYQCLASSYIQLSELLKKSEFDLGCARKRNQVLAMDLRKNYERLQVLEKDALLRPGNCIFIGQRDSAHSTSSSMPFSACSRKGSMKSSCKAQYPVITETGQTSSSGESHGNLQAVEKCSLCKPAKFAFQSISSKTEVISSNDASVISIAHPNQSDMNSICRHVPSTMLSPGAPICSQDAFSVAHSERGALNSRILWKPEMCVSMVHRATASSTDFLVPSSSCAFQTISGHREAVGSSSASASVVSSAYPEQSVMNKPRELSSRMTSGLDKAVVSSDASVTSFDYRECCAMDKPIKGETVFPNGALVVSPVDEEQFATNSKCTHQHADRHEMKLKPASMPITRNILDPVDEISCKMAQLAVISSSKQQMLGQNLRRKRIPGLLYLGSDLKSNCVVTNADNQENAFSLQTVGASVNYSEKRQEFRSPVKCTGQKANQSELSSSSCCDLNYTWLSTMQDDFKRMRSGLPIPQSISIRLKGTMESKASSVKSPILSPFCPKWLHVKDGILEDRDQSDQVVAWKKKSKSSRNQARIVEIDGPVSVELNVTEGRRQNMPKVCKAYPQGTYKTERCNKMASASGCPYGRHCIFAHAAEELRPVMRHIRYKTEPCRIFAAGETCPYGHRCHFLHCFQRHG